jgi:hypothetical protein
LIGWAFSLIPYIIDTVSFKFYCIDFIRLVNRNFKKVPRSKVLSNMIYSKFLPDGLINEYYSIESALAAKFRNKEISIN